MEQEVLNPSTTQVLVGRTTLAFGFSGARGAFMFFLQLFMVKQSLKTKGWVLATRPFRAWIVFSFVQLLEL